MPHWILAIVLPVEAGLLILGADSWGWIAGKWRRATRGGIPSAAGRLSAIWVLKRPVVGILSDMRWDTAATGSTATYTEIPPEEWRKLIAVEARKHGIPVRILDARMDRAIDRYAVLLNPYGGVYPDVSRGGADSVDLCLAYVRQGGTYINVADVPGAWAYVADRRLRYPALHVHENESEKLQLIETPLSRRLGLRFYRPTGRPVHLPLAPDSAENGDGQMVISADAFCQSEWDTGTGKERLVTPIFEPVGTVEGRTVSPAGQKGAAFFAVSYGEGQFVFSTPILRCPSDAVAIQHQAKSIAREAVRVLLPLASSSLRRP